MTTLLPILSAGVIAGAAHVFMGPDHLAAVAPLALVERNRSWVLGVRWGLGHASGVILVALVAWLFRELLPVELFSSHCERLVGVMLIGIGVWGLRKALRFKLHVHEHSHGDEPHLHLHAHHSSHKKTHVHTHASLVVGILHGLAGGSHFLGVLPALAMPTQQAAAVYLVAFGVGTVVAMASFSLILGIVGAKFEASGAKWFKRLMAVSSGASIAVGGYWLGA